MSSLFSLLITLSIVPVLVSLFMEYIKQFGSDFFKDIYCIFFIMFAPFIGIAIFGFVDFILSKLL